MLSRLRLVPALTASLLALGACGSDARTTQTSTAPSTGATTAPSTGATYPADADTALVWIGRPGEVPRLVIGGDGWVYTPAANTVAAQGIRAAAAIPAPAPPVAFERRRLTAQGVGFVFDLADRLGLLATPGEYADPGVTDMESTEVVVGDGTSTYVHTAYALGFGTETGNRKRLLEFVDAIADLPALVGAAQLGAAEPYVPARYRVTDAVTFVRGPQEPQWPAAVPVTLGCVTLPAEEFPGGVAGVYVANVDGTATRLAVIPDLPGDDCR